MEGEKHRKELPENDTRADVYRHFYAAGARSLQRCFVCSTNLLVTAPLISKPSNDEDRFRARCRATRSQTLQVEWEDTDESESERVRQSGLLNAL